MNKPFPSIRSVSEPTPPEEYVSCFLPGTNIQFAWDSTSLGYLKQCPRLYELVMIEGWESKDESIHLRFGIEYHAALEMYDKGRVAGLSHLDSLRDAVHDLLFRIKDWDPDIDTKAGHFKNRHSLVRSVIWYAEHYQDDNAQTFVKSDGKAAVEQSFRFELDYGPDTEGPLAQPYVLCGHLDKVAVYMDEPFVLDRKTTTLTLSEYYFKQFEPNNQMSLYTIASRIVLNASIKGVIVDAAQVAIGFTRFVRDFTYRSTDQLEEWLVDLRVWLRAAERYAIEGYWPQNDTACDKFGGCRFREICSKSPGVRKQFLKANFTQLPKEERWNPLKPR